MPWTSRRLWRIEVLSMALPFAVVTMLSLLPPTRRRSASCCKRASAVPFVSCPPVGCLVLTVTGGTGGADLKMGETDLRRIARLEEAFMTLTRLAKATSTSTSLSQFKSIFNFLHVRLRILLRLWPFYSEDELMKEASRIRSGLNFQTIKSVVVLFLFHY